jgi:transcriptional regulator with XRE-family HTH domain
MSNYPNHLKAWREYRRMTQQELADAVGTSPNVISLLESGKRGLSLNWLYRLATPLRTRPGILLEHHPASPSREALEVWSQIEEVDQARAIRALKGYLPEDQPQPLERGAQ